MLPPELIDIILTYHRPICVEGFTGNPNFTLYWMYSKEALREILGMSNEKFKQIKSRLGPFLRRVPKTQEWVASVPWLGPARGSNAMPRQGQAAAHSQISRRSYVGGNASIILDTAAD